MAHSHSHSGGSHIETTFQTKRLLFLAVAPFVIATLAGVVVLWPSGPPRNLSRAVELPEGLVNATVLDSRAGSCEGAEGPGAPSCQLVRTRLTEGTGKGEIVTFEHPQGSTVEPIRRGDKIVLGKNSTGPVGQEYYLADRQRRAPMAAMALIFAATVIALGRWRGVASLLGFGISLVILAMFILPAILAGKNPVAVSIVGASSVMLVALYLAHGINVRTTTALLGTMISLMLTAALAYVFIRLGQFSGFTSEEAIFVNVAANTINMKGLLLGGIIIGGLGVLDDVTITQSSAVWELKTANPAFTTAQLYTSAMRIGRDHIASAVNTLVLAYAGASLPLLVLFAIAGSNFTDVLNGEIVAEEVLRTLVGSIGLVASVPLTTAMAAAIAGGGPFTRESGAGEEPDVSSPEEDFWARR